VGRVPPTYGLVLWVGYRRPTAWQGSGVEIPPLTAPELHELIGRRVRHYRSREGVSSPISLVVLQKLFDASVGEIRMVLKLADDLVRRIVASFRASVAEQLPEATSSSEFSERFDQVLGEALASGALPDALVETHVRNMIEEQLGALSLRPKEPKFLNMLGAEGEARAKDHNEYKVKSMQDFSSNYLSKLFKMNLLHRRQAGRAVYYRLRGLPALAHSYGLLDKLLLKD